MLPHFRSLAWSTIRYCIVTGLGDVASISSYPLPPSGLRKRRWRPATQYLHWKWVDQKTFDRSIACIIALTIGLDMSSAVLYWPVVTLSSATTLHLNHLIVSPIIYDTLESKPLSFTKSRVVRHALAKVNLFSNFKGPTLTDMLASSARFFQG